MAKRKKSKPKRSKASLPAGVSAKSYERLIKEGRNARRRIAAFQARPDASNYFIPDASSYTLNGLLARIAGGERVQDLFREMRNLTAEKLKIGTPVGVTSKDGYQLTARDKRRVIENLAAANKNIQQAHKDYSFATDILPPEFNSKDFIRGITSKQSLENHIKGLQLFTPENLIPTAVNADGEAGTIAEYKYYMDIIERENKRRERLRAQTDPRQVKGNFIQTDEYERRPIDTSVLHDMESLRKKALTWDDLARIERANLFLENYIKQFETVEAGLVSQGYFAVQPELEQKFDKIKAIINRFMWNEEAITYISRQMPNLSIAFVSGGLEMHGGTFDNIYDDWLKVDKMF